MKLTIPIIFEDRNILVVNKPPGISVHGDGVREEETLVDWILENYPKMKGVGEKGYAPQGGEIERPGVVHRLDKDTSGVLILAKNKKTHAFLKEQFQERQTEKTYQVLVHGLIKDDVGLIQAPIGKSKGDFRKRTTAQPIGIVRDAITEYKVLERFPVREKVGYDITYLEAYPKTGRTHQIRVHMKYLHHPVLCDSLYGGKLPCLPEMGRLALHASELQIQVPGGGKMTFKAPLPGDFSAALALVQSLC